MGTQGTGRKRNPNKDRSTAEDDALNLISREAEARLAAKRAARAEAREIRMKELERQQKEIYQVQKKYYGLDNKSDKVDSEWGHIEQWMEDSERYSRPTQRHTSISDDDERMSVGSRGSVRVEDRDYLEKGSRATSTLSAATLASLGGSSSRGESGETSITGDTETSIREIKEIHELKDQIQDVESKYMQSLKEVKDTLVEVEEKYRKAMVSNAQLDNEKNNLMYQVDTLKDSLMELEELLSESRREYEGKSKDFEREKHAHGVLQFQFKEMKETLKQSEELLTEIRQMRLKQDGFVREISDLQETVEWKDKKIGALERQKEYSDAIRNERDELRDEVVQLKDILKKHGIVLRPDLTANGEMLELGTEGSASGDPASQLAQDSQTSPMEGGNSMLGRAQETELGSRGDKVVDPGRSRQQEDTHEEEAQENHLTSPTPCSLVGVSETETPREAQPFSPTLGEEVEIEGSDVNKDSDNGIPVVEVKSGPVCDSQVLVVVTGPEEEVTVAGEGYEAAGVEGTGQGRVEVASEGEMGIKNDKADEAETKVVKSSDDTKETSSKEPTSEYGAAAEQEKNESSKDVKCLDSYPLPRETIEDTMKNSTQISQGTDLDTSKSPIKSNPEPRKTKKAEALPEITDLQPQAQAGNKKKKGKKKKGETQSDVKQEDHKKSTTETCLVSMTNGTQISLGTDLYTPKTPVESNPEPQKTKKACVLPETTDMQPQPQGGKKKKKGKKKGEKQGDETQGDKMSTTEEDVVSTPSDKEPVEAVGEGVITIETQREEGTGSSPDRELQSPEQKAQTIAEGLNLKEEQLEEDRVEPTIEVSLTDQAKSEEVVSKKKKKKMKKDKHKPTMELEKSEGEISVLSLESNIGIADPVDHSKCITSAYNPMEELESTTDTGTQKDESGYTTNHDNFGDCLKSSADPKCPLDSKQSTAGNSNNVKEEDAIKVSVEEEQTIQDSKELEGNNFHSPIVLRPELKESVEPEDLIFHDGVATHPDQANENATQDLKEAGQDKPNGSPEERTNALEHEDTSMAMPANVEKCNNSADEKCCSISRDRNCPAAETIRLPEQLVDLPGCPVTDRHLYENNKPETLDAEEASNGGISTETELNDTETLDAEEASNGVISTETELNDAEEASNGGISTETELNDAETLDAEEASNGGISTETELNDAEEASNGGISTETELNDAETLDAEEASNGGISTETELNDAETLDAEEASNGGISTETELNDAETLDAEEASNGGISTETELNDAEEASNGGISTETELNDAEEASNRGISTETELNDAETLDAEEASNGGISTETELNDAETLDAEEASNGGISTETELNDTETRLQDPVKETPVTIDSFREQRHNESGPCTMVAKAEEQDDPIEAKLKRNKVPGPSEQWNDKEHENEGQSFDFSDLVSVVPANVFPIASQEEVSQEMRTMSVGYKIEVELGKEKGNQEEQDDKPQDTEGVSTIVAEESIEGGSDNAPEELRSPEEKAQTIVEAQNLNGEQQLITLEEGVSVTYNQKYIAEEGGSVTVEQQGVGESERQQNATEVDALPVEEGEEAIQYGSQQGRRESSQSAEGNNEQSRTGLKKGSKKVKGKGKEDCRMS
ncbi:muscle M-line assembly protein unc-89-like isoform X3 [Oncorhynchus keta]|uniref:muscle M-line assembly protein unc-89-like isoform X3 n=1 Tax=Oncorhynchus keta TaxID=8018 RepID=UPI00227D36C5|nr:muscle M-line assembly protein unc-89-like isoform X3 [Oncorhynchus keta]